MIGHIVPGPGRAMRVRLFQTRVLEMPVLRAEAPGGMLKPRHARRAAQALRKKGVRRVLVPPDFPFWDEVARKGLQPVETGDFCRSLACPIALAALAGAGVRPQEAAVVFRGERVTRSMRMAALALCPQVKHLLIAAPAGGEALRAELRREYGVPALEDSPARRPDLSVLFTPGSGRGEQIADLSGPAPALERFTFSTADGALPEDCEALPLLCALWETGRLDPAGITVFADFRT